MMQFAFRNRILVTGCSGFIGSHLAIRGAQEGLGWDGLDLNAPDRFAMPVTKADIRHRRALRRIARKTTYDAVIHLAALGEVLIPWEQLHALYATNAMGTYHLLGVFSPSLFVFASTSAVYGNALGGPAKPEWDQVHPVGHYGLSKAAGELFCMNWASAGQRSAVLLRFGNVVGPGCRGLVRYLIEHALRFPRAEQPAQLRGQGRLVRDYVPVEFVVEALLRTVATSWAPGVHILNIGSGRGMTNGMVVDIARDELQRYGLSIRPQWSATAAAGEAQAVVLDPEMMSRRLGVEAPDEAAVESSIRNAIRQGVQQVRREVPCVSS